jgi:hypothetical protein
MAILHLTENRDSSHHRTWLATESSPLIAALIAGFGTLGLALLLPQGLVFPVLSILLIAVALGLAFLTRRRRDERASAGWYVSAALTFIGFGIALLTDPEHVLPAFENATRNH